MSESGWSADGRLCRATKGECRATILLRKRFVVLQSPLEQSLVFVAEFWTQSVGSGPFAKPWIGWSGSGPCAFFRVLRVLAGVVNSGVYRPSRLNSLRSEDLRRF